MTSLFMIAQHFPPSSAPPFQRVRLQAKHGAWFGFYPTVFTVSAKYREEIEDEWLFELLGKYFYEK